MIHKVTAKQNNSKMCFICGLKNDCNLKAAFYETDKDELITVFKPTQKHQRYHGKLHGVIVAAILDEAIGRNINLGHSGRSGEWQKISRDFTVKPDEWLVVESEKDPGTIKLKHIK